ncbi:MAG: hypothetical protein WDZ66_08585 [Steroidobacteraceae bacterium]
MRFATLTAVLLIAGHLTACQHQPTISYPKLPEAGPVEAAFDCARLDDAILKSEAVRWVMREDGARLLSPGERAARTTTDIATTVAATAACLLCPTPVVLGEEGHKVLNGADRRLVSLLKLKQDKRCAELPTALAGMTDLQMYDALARLLAQETQKEPGTDVGELRAERMRLLDKLRP